MLLLNVLDKRKSVDSLLNRKKLKRQELKEAILAVILQFAMPP